MAVPVCKATQNEEREREGDRQRDGQAEESIQGHGALMVRAG